jgi:epoxyqueuosine reductase
MRKREFLGAAAECGFELAGVAPALPLSDYARYAEWVRRGYAGEMRYLTDRRNPLRADPRNLLAAARSILVLGMLYNTPHPPARRISRYAWGEDYHAILRAALERLRDRLLALWGPFESKVCVDTAPLLEKAYAREAGLGWIGKNTCLIHEPAGSWYFLGELLVSVEVEPDTPPPDRCGSCRRCIDACPTQALEPYLLDARRCISYLTIEHRGEIAPELRGRMGEWIYGCDICQDVCPWNQRAPVTAAPAFQPTRTTPPDRWAKPVKLKT